MQRRLQPSIFTAILAFLAIFPPQSMAWNIPTHMLNGLLTYQILQHKSPSTIEAVRALFEKHPWYESRWQARLESVPAEDRDEMLFMLAARWSDDIRFLDRKHHRGAWHYINFPFKPEGQPDSVRTRDPEKENILTALTANEQTVRTGSTPEKRAIALAWVFHLVGDVHQPLHTAALFTVDYRDGDRGGNEICIRSAPDGRPMDLHRFWDGLITSSSNVPRLRNEATALRNRPDFARNRLNELVSQDFEAWAKESFEIAKKAVYQNGTVPGTPKGVRRDCIEVLEAAVLPAGYAQVAGQIADHRIVLAGYRLASLLATVMAK